MLFNFRVTAAAASIAAILPTQSLSNPEFSLSFSPFNNNTEGSTYLADNSFYKDVEIRRNGPILKFQYTHNVGNTPLYGFMRLIATQANVSVKPHKIHAHENAKDYSEDIQDKTYDMLAAYTPTIEYPDIKTPVYGYFTDRFGKGPTLRDNVLLLNATAGMGLKIPINNRLSFGGDAGLGLQAQIWNSGDINGPCVGPYAEAKGFLQYNLGGGINIQASVTSHLNPACAFRGHEVLYNENDPFSTRFQIGVTKVLGTAPDKGQHPARISFNNASVNAGSYNRITFSDDQTSVALSGEGFQTLSFNRGPQQGVYAEFTHQKSASPWFTGFRVSAGVSNINGAITPDYDSARRFAEQFYITGNDISLPSELDNHPIRNEVIENGADFINDAITDHILDQNDPHTYTLSGKEYELSFAGKRGRAFIMLDNFNMSAYGSIEVGASYADMEVKETGERFERLAPFAGVGLGLNAEWALADNFAITGGLEYGIRGYGPSIVKDGSVGAENSGHIEQGGRIFLGGELRF